MEQVGTAGDWGNNNHRTSNGQPFLQWHVLEWVIDVAADLVYAEDTSPVRASFIAPSGQTYDTVACWDGPGRWLVRFMPTVPGTWSYRLIIPRATTGSEQRGTFLVDASDSVNPLYQHGGILKVSANQRCLTYTDGTPFFWLGDTWWFCPSPLVPFDGSSRPGDESMYRTLIDTRQAQGYSTIHMAFLGSSGVNWADIDIAAGTIAVDYWRMVDRYITYANDAGLIPVIGFSFHQGLNDPSLAALCRHWGYVLARYAAYSITFLICGEYNQAAQQDPVTQQHILTADDLVRIDKMMQVGQFIKDNDPYQRAMTIHPWAFSVEKYQAWDQPWYDFIMIQGSHHKEGPSQADYLRIYRRPHPKPLLEGECTYEGIFGFTDEVVRHNAYKAIQSGSFGYTYGSHGLWYPNQNAQDQRFDEYGAPVPWWDALVRPGGAQMSHLRALYASIEWWTLEPLAEEEVLTRSIGPATDWQQVTVRAAAQRLFVLYVPGDQHPQQHFTLNLGDDGRSYSIRFFDPRTGVYIHLDEPFAVRNSQLPLPALPDQQDWLIIVEHLID